MSDGHNFAEDELVSLDDLQEKVQEFEDFVQSTDIAAMQSMSIPVFSMSSRADLAFLQSCKRLV